MVEEPNQRRAREAAARGRIPALDGATPCRGDAETLPPESWDDDPSRENLFRRGQTAIELLEAIRASDPERLADSVGIPTRKFQRRFATSHRPFPDSS